MPASHEELPQWPQALAGLAASGRRISIDADERQRAAIARAYDLLGVECFTADVTLAPWAGVGVRLKGRLMAEVTQACVVTLAPVKAWIEEEFTRRFMDERARERRRMPVEKEIEIHLEDDDPPEPLSGNVLMLGPVLLEQFALALDPYPRSAAADDAGVVAMGQDGGEVEQGGRDPSPFDKLRLLKGGG